MYLLLVGFDNQTLIESILEYLEHYSMCFDQQYRVHKSLTKQNIFIIVLINFIIISERLSESQIY
jgi:hypothetical protein